MFNDCNISLFNYGILYLYLAPLYPSISYIKNTSGSGLTFIQSYCHRTGKQTPQPLRVLAFIACMKCQ